MSSSPAAAPPRTRSGLIKFRPLRPGGRIALVAPASSFARDEFDAGMAEITRLGFTPVFDDSIFDRQMFTAGTPRVRTLAGSAPNAVRTENDESTASSIAW